MDNEMLNKIKLSILSGERNFDGQMFCYIPCIISQNKLTKITFE